MEIKIIYRDAAVVRKSIDEANRKATFIASTPTRDSEGWSIPLSAWANGLGRFSTNGIIGYQHNVYRSTDPDDVIGKGVAYLTSDALMVDITFEPTGTNEKADKIWGKLVFGSLNAVSVGFIETEDGNFVETEDANGNKTRSYVPKACELYEISVVNLPSNPDALCRMADIKAAIADALKEAKRKPCKDEDEDDEHDKPCENPEECEEEDGCKPKKDEDEEQEAGCKPKKSIDPELEAKRIEILNKNE